ncbi:MAG: HslU--HslV peptidase proteolytic subunit, partial [Planctomycetes bacterium]|nr:HslU--HslV peptidase proteolytic subunit [Planctomycetota bacterium]
APRPLAIAGWTVGTILEHPTGLFKGRLNCHGPAKALLAQTELPPDEIVKESLNIAADICVFTNHNIIVETL